MEPFFFAEYFCVKKADAANFLSEVKKHVAESGMRVRTQGYETQETIWVSENSWRVQQENPFVHFVKVSKEKDAAQISYVQRHGIKKACYSVSMRKEDAEFFLVYKQMKLDEYPLQEQAWIHMIKRQMVAGAFKPLFLLEKQEVHLRGETVNVVMKEKVAVRPLVKTTNEIKGETGEEDQCILIEVQFRHAIPYKLGCLLLEYGFVPKQHDEYQAAYYVMSGKRDF